MGTVVPQDDLPDSLKGTAVPESDLPDATPAPKPAENMARSAGIKEPPAPVDPRFGKPVSALRAAMGNDPLAGEKALGQTAMSGVLNAIGYVGSGVEGAGEVLGQLPAVLKGDKRIGDVLSTAGGNVQQHQQNAAAKVNKLMPPTPTAQNMQNTMSSVFEKGKEFAGQGAQGIQNVAKASPFPMARTAANAISPDAAKAIGEAGFEAGTALEAPVRGLLGAKGIRPVTTQPQRAMLKATDNGFAANPVDTNPSIANKLMGLATNKRALDEHLLNQNAAKATEWAKKDVGIHTGPETDLNGAALDKASKPHLNAYSAVEKAGKESGISFAPDAELGQALQGADALRAEQKQVYPEFYKNDTLERVKSVIMNPAKEPTAGQVMQLARDLRAEASQNLKNPTLTANEFKGIKATKEVATILEDFIDRKLNALVFEGGDATAIRQIAGPGGSTSAPLKVGTLTRQATKDYSQVLKDYRKARTALAKIEDVRGATNLETGRIDPAKLAGLDTAGDKLTGGLAKIAQAHKAMAHTVRHIEGASPNTGLRASDPGLAHAVLQAGAEATAAPAAGRVVMATKAYRDFMGNPTRSSLQVLKELDPAMAARAVAALNAAQAGQTNSKLPEPQK